MGTRTARIIRARRRRRNQKRGNAQQVFRYIIAALLGLLGLVVVGVLVFVGILVGTYLSYASELPPPTDIETVLEDRNFETTVLYDRTGQNVLYEVISQEDGDRQSVTLAELPDDFINATIAIEDANFYNNPGFNVRGIVRALWANFTGGQIQGGSSITQQLVKNVLIEEEERTQLSVDRKISEIILASEISRLYSKDQILEWYVNTNFYGNLAYGIEAAARVYFNKSARDLNLAEAAILAAIPQFPLQNPIDNLSAAKTRQEIVLNRMVLEGYITQAEADAALAEPLDIRQFNDRFDIEAPHFSFYARNEAEQLLNEMGLDGAFLISQGGVRIYTTLDVDLQRQLECTSSMHVARLNDPNALPQECAAAAYLPNVPPELQGIQRDVTNAAGVMLRAETGEIVAMTGSVNFWDESIDGNFNVATAERQPGSVFKPFVYLAAFVTPLDQSTIVTPATLTTDIQIEFDVGTPDPYVPTNIDNQYHGPVSVRDALANSYNVPAVQVLNWVGLSQTLRTARRMGINSLNGSLDEYGLAMALGSEEVTLLDITYAYNVINNAGTAVGRPVHASRARDGFRQLDPVAVLRIETADGETLWEYSQEIGTFDRRTVIEPGIAYIMTDILSDVEARWPAFGEGNALELSRQAAAKTGTTNDNRDSWTIGYTPQYTMGVWVGNNDNRSMNDITGISGAAPIWNAMMEYVHIRDSLEAAVWGRPSTVVEQSVCVWSGMLPTENCPQVPGELFYYNPVNGVDYRPQQQDTMWYRLPINICNNTIANDTTPAQCIDNDTLFFDFPEELQGWAQANVPDLMPPQEEDVFTEDSIFNPVAIVSPRSLTQVGGVVEVLGNTDLDNLDYFQIGYGVGAQPDTYTQLGERSDVQDFGHVLGTWDTTALEDGLYTLRLQVVQTDNVVVTRSARITVDNTAPEIRLTEPLQATTYYADQDVFVPLEAEVFDAGGITRVEFYTLDGDEITLIGETTAFPYSWPWTIEGTGLRTFWAVVFDQAENRTESERIIVNLEAQAP